MTPKRLSLKSLKRARRGSKHDWPALTGQLPPELHKRALLYAQMKGISKTDLVRLAVEQWIDKEAA